MNGRRRTTRHRHLRRTRYVIIPIREHWMHYWGGLNNQQRLLPKNIKLKNLYSNFERLRVHEDKAKFSRKILAEIGIKTRVQHIPDKKIKIHRIIVPKESIVKGKQPSKKPLSPTEALTNTKKEKRIRKRRPHAINKLERQKLVDNLSRKYDIDWQTVDWTARIDSSLSYAENKTILEEYVRSIKPSARFDDPERYGIDSKTGFRTDDKDVKRKIQALKYVEASPNGVTSKDIHDKFGDGGLIQELKIEGRIYEPKEGLIKAV